MDISVSTVGAVAKMEMSGRFDFNMHRAFREAYDPVLSKGGIQSLEIDMGRVEYLDSSALGMLLLLRERAQTARVSVVLCRPSSAVMQILEIANFNKLFGIR